jgi:hypothetical protein
MQKPVKPQAFLNPRHRAAWDLIERRPDFYRLFDHFTRDRIGKGFTRYGAHEIIQQIRWHTNVPGENSKVKISNNHFPYLARIWMATNPAHDGFFKVHAVEGSEFG